VGPGKSSDDLGLDGLSDSDDMLKASLEAPSDSLEGSGGFPGGLRAAPKRKGNPLARGGSLRAGLGLQQEKSGGPGSLRQGQGTEGSLAGGTAGGGIKGLNLTSLRPKAKASGANRFSSIDWSQASDMRW